jgi:diadenosine tetraphosphate (Ap4A) HIT family hydrolase
MSHLYQPLMLKLLIERGGWVSTREIASAFLARDESQVDYYAEITKRMPGKVLANHGLVKREKDGFRLVPDPQTMTCEERSELSRICDEAIARYVEKRGRLLFGHRRTALGDISGTVRYEVLRRAGFRCELCGISAEERAIEVDHILPRRHGGQDDLSNLQALCYRCNANKGARDDTDFRLVREGLNARLEGCIFCNLADRPVLTENGLAFAIHDKYPVTPNHTVVIPRRHAATFFDLTDPERRAINLILDDTRQKILAADRTVEGFNVGMNCGDVAGQTVMHCHVHLIPRRKADVSDPRGGVRGIIPGKAVY